ncbi:MAG: hypothetical protein HZA88_04155 [Verrucomicrobia bacterium]|nr:hypothetical protein [Verrucomicrobiota bacterium]
MKKMKKSAHGAGSLWTLGELVTLAYDVTPNRASAVKLLGVLLGGQPIRVRTNSGG